MDLSSNPFTGNRYGFGGGNPISAIELDGHLFGLSLSDLGHMALDAVGMVPVVGAVADVANSVWYAAEGDWGNAALSLAGAIPVIGDAAVAAKYGIKGAKYAIKAAEAGEDVVKGVRAVRTAAHAAEDVKAATRAVEEAKIAKQAAKAAAERKAAAEAAAARAAAAPRPRRREGPRRSHRHSQSPKPSRPRRRPHSVGSPTRQSSFVAGQVTFHRPARCSRVPSGGRWRRPPPAFPMAKFAPPRLERFGVEVEPWSTVRSQDHADGDGKPELGWPQASAADVR